MNWKLSPCSTRWCWATYEIKNRSTSCVRLVVISILDSTIDLFCGFEYQDFLDLPVQGDGGDCVSTVRFTKQIFKVPFSFPQFYV
jgi:hypothetical protein